MFKTTERSAYFIFSYPKPTDFDAKLPFLGMNALYTDYSGLG